MLDIGIQSRFLEKSSSETVYKWLEQNASDLWCWSGNPEEENVELMLLHRNEPIIDLALALFSWNSEIRISLYDTSDSVLQKAVLTNKRCGYFPELEGLLKSENIEYLEILLINTENRLFLVDLYKKQNIFEKINQDFWIRLLELTLINNILKYPYSKGDKQWDDDIGTEAYATRLYRAIYGLFNILAVTDENACLLARLVEILPRVRDSFAVKEPLELIQKWKNKREVEHSDYIYFLENRDGWNPTCDEYFKKIEESCWVEHNYFTCRTHLAYFWRASENNDSDPAIRMAYYRSENFNLNKEKGNYLIENWKRISQKDGLLFKETIVDNISIYYNKSIRDFIGDDGIILSKVTIVEKYQKILMEQQEAHPEFFPDKTQDKLLEKIEEKISLKNFEIVNVLNNQVTMLCRENKTIKNALYFLISLFVISILLWWIE